MWISRGRRRNGLAGLDDTPLGFGRSPDGELYLLATNFDGNGTVYRIASS